MGPGNEPPPQVGGRYPQRGHAEGLALYTYVLSTGKVSFFPGTPEAGLASVLWGAVLHTLESHLGKSPSFPSSLPSCAWIYSLLKPSLQLSGCRLPNLRPLTAHRSSPRGLRDQPLGGHPQTQGCARGREHRAVRLGRRRPEEIGLSAGLRAQAPGTGAWGVGKAREYLRGCEKGWSLYVREPPWAVPTWKAGAGPGSRRQGRRGSARICPSQLA